MKKETYKLIGEFCDKFPGAGGTIGLMRLVLSLYNANAWSFSLPNCLGNLDETRMEWAKQLIADYIEHGETHELVELGEKLADRILPFEWPLDLANVTHDASITIRYPHWDGLARQIAMFVGDHCRQPLMLFGGDWKLIGDEWELKSPPDMGRLNVWPGKIDDPRKFLLQCPGGEWLEVEPREGSFIFLR